MAVDPDQTAVDVLLDLDSTIRDVGKDELGLIEIAPREAGFDRDRAEEGIMEAQARIVATDLDHLVVDDAGFVEAAWRIGRGGQVRGGEILEGRFARNAALSHDLLEDFPAFEVFLVFSQALREPIGESEVEVEFRLRPHP